MGRVKKKMKGKPHSNAKRVKKMGVLWASRSECYRGIALKRLEQAGIIKNLQLQPRFELWVENKKVCAYIADFRYQQGKKDVVEDVKGRIFPVYRLKVKLYRALYPEHTFYEVKAIRKSKKRPKVTWNITEIK